ncbi:hypothetical protein F4778DRAFT_392732 [Xylariomycetidae sp. FL2044]|nr:hypothetical protein F4778DRAFT_392732 [Xylariomycetidae sp. FL2044]
MLSPKSAALYKAQFFFPAHSEPRGRVWRLNRSRMWSCGSAVFFRLSSFGSVPLLLNPFRFLWVLPALRRNGVTAFQRRHISLWGFISAIEIGSILCLKISSIRL